MDGGKIVIRYAKAFYELAKENKIVDVVIEDVKNIITLFDEEIFIQFINNILIRPSEKFKIINELLSENININTLKFLELIIKNGKENYLKRILIHVIDLYNRDNKIKKANLISAYPLTDDFKKKLNSILKDKLNYDFIFEEKVDKNIIGGFVLYVDGLQIDASVKSNLKKIKKELINK